MLEALENDEELQCILKLNDFVQSVKNKHSNNKKQIGELSDMFKELNNKIQAVYKDQTVGSVTSSKQKKGAAAATTEKK